tara:strand:- start:10995 stop:11993 length:999 start_codon:yes stop_codon:yes gene_type:complete
MIDIKTVRKSATSWEKVPIENPIARRMNAAKFRLNDLGDRGGIGTRAAYLCGPPGVGKTYNIVQQEKYWKENGIDTIRFRPRNVHDLLDHFKMACGKSPLVMEEADVIFRSRPMFEILKQATDPETPDKFHRFEKVKTTKVSVYISLNVPIIVSTNMDLLKDDGWDKNLLPDRDALFERAMPISVPNDPFFLWEWSVYLALTSRLTEPVTIRNPNGGMPIKANNSLAVQAAAIDWFTDHVPSLISISPRILKKVAALFGRIHRGDMPQHIADDELSGLVGKKRDMPAPKKADWITLLTSVPKSSLAQPKISGMPVRSPNPANNPAHESKKAA